MRKLLIILSLCIPLFGVGQVDGPNIPSAVTTSGGGLGWQNTGNVFTDDNTISRTLQMSNGNVSQALVVSGFGFSVPAGATIDGIEVVIEKRRNANGGGNVRDNTVSLVKDGSTLVGDDNSLGGNYPAAFTVYTYGGATDLWGVIWTVSEINSANFGVGISMRKTGGDIRRGLIDYYTITVYYTPVPLPIELLSFNVEVNNNSVVINWATASESNNERFIVEKTHDGVNFDFVGEIGGSANSNKEINYKLIDNNPYIGDSYYRLTQVDYDGRSETFDMAHIHIDSEAYQNMVVYPNPTQLNEIINVKFNGFNGGEILMIVMDIQGRTHYSKVLITKTSGETIHSIDPHDRISGGTYMIVGSTNDELYFKTIVIE